MSVAVIENWTANNILYKIKPEPMFKKAHENDIKSD